MVVFLNWIWAYVWSKHGARVIDHHGMTETGPVSYGCPARPDVLHVIESMTQGGAESLLKLDAKRMARGGTSRA